MIIMAITTHSICGQSISEKETKKPKKKLKIFFGKTNRITDNKKKGPNTNTILRDTKVVLAGLSANSCGGDFYHSLTN
jgi:hypothetical protein